MKNRNIIAFVLLLLVVYAVATAVRLRQYSYVLNSSAHNTGEHIILANNDGYRWLRFAGDYMAGKYHGGKDVLSGIPEMSNIPQRVPAISFLIAQTARAADISIEKSAGILTVFLPSVFVFPLGLFFYFAGSYAAGAGAAVTGSLAYAYLSRTSAFQPDTDMLNLFFPSLTVLFIFLSGSGRRAYAALAGFAAYLHYLWYGHAGFVTLWCLMLAVHLFLSGRRGKDFFHPILLFCVFCGGWTLFYGFAGLREFAGNSYNVAIAENRVLPFFSVLKMFTADGYTALLGIAAFIFMLKKHYAVLPLFVLGLFVFFRGERYGMYLAPFAGAGIGFALQFALKKIPRGGLYACAAAVAVCILLVRPYLFMVPAPYVSKELFESLKQVPAEAGARAVCHWDMGFVIEYLKNVRCSSDGASQKKEGRVLTDRIITSAYMDADALERLSKGERTYVFLTADDYSKAQGKGFYTYTECAGNGLCGETRISAEIPADKVFSLGKAMFIDSEQKKTVYGKFSPGKDSLALFDADVLSSFFGQSFIIGLTDIGSMRLIYRNYPILAVYVHE